MELNRRNFIKLVLGGVAGIHATPLPWKLTDDIAIWTQNWPWVPVPQRGKFHYETSVCTLCPGGCGISVRMVDKRAVKIEGRTDYPVNPGGICPMGAGGLQLLYNEDCRFISPMKRVGPRGSGKFKEITWQEAIGELSSRIKKIRESGRPEAIAGIDGYRSGTTMSLLIERFIKAIGSPNYIRMPSMEDAYSTASQLMMGSNGPMAFDLENSDFILSFGSGLIDGWGAPGRMLNAWGLWHSDSRKNKVKIVQVEPRGSNTASKATDWIPVRPGTESALALGMAHVMIKEGKYNREFVENYTFGFEDWFSEDGTSHMGFKTLVLKDYSPEKVSRITGLSKGLIIRLANEFSSAKYPVAVCGKGKGDMSGSVLEFMSVLALNALKGNINMPGGVIILDPLPLSPLPEVELDQINLEGLNKPRIDKAGGKRYPLSGSLAHIFGKIVAESKQSPVELLMVFSSNPAYTLPGATSFRKALKKIPYIVSFSPFKDETSMFADLILPDHTNLEKMEDIVSPPGLQYAFYGVSKPVVEPLYNTGHTGDVIIQVAKAVGGAVSRSFPWEGFEDCVRSRVKGLYESGKGLTTFDASTPIWEQLGKGNPRSDYRSFDDMWNSLKSDGFWFSAGNRYGNWDNIFKTSHGKFEFYSTQLEGMVSELGGDKEATLKEMGIRVKGDPAFMPHYEEILSVNGSGYRLVPYEIINLSSGWLPTPPYTYKSIFDHELLKNESFVEINPVVADELGIKEGDRVIIKSKAGSVKVRVHISDVAMPGFVFMPAGFGHTAYDDFQKGKGSNPMDIIVPDEDPMSGYPLWWKTDVEIRKI